jgi:hypothetical protein
MISRRLLVLSGILLPVFGIRDAEAQEIVVEVKKITRSPRSGGTAIFPLFKTYDPSQPTTSFQGGPDFEAERESIRTNSKASTQL